MSTEQTQPFSRMRQIFWPVHAFELKKLIPMLLLFFFLYLNYNILRTMKDTLVVTAKLSGAEVIPFIKVWVMFPMALVLTFLYTRFANWYSAEKVFYVMTGIFLVYFLFFITCLYPNEAYLHPHAFADKLELILPEGLKGMIAMVRYWSFTSFYVMSELWGTMILFTLFWGFANQITHMEEARRFYGIFGVGANISGVVAGVLGKLLIEYAPFIPLGSIDQNERWLYLLVGLVLLCGILAIAVFRWMHVSVLTDPRFSAPKHTEQKQEKTRLGLRDSFAYLLKSRYLTYIAVIVIAYNVIINLTEVLWKHEVKALYPNPMDYSSYQYQVTIVISVIATLASLFVSGNVIRVFGWTFTAMLTPVILLLTSIGFFYTFFMKEALGSWTHAVLGIEPLVLVVFLGTLQNCCSRAAKYTVFDASRELAYVPLSPTCQRKGKAAIDGVCSRLGKSGGSLMYQVLLLSCANIISSAPYIALCLFATLIIWIVATRLLGIQFNALTEPQSQAPVWEGEGQIQMA